MPTIEQPTIDFGPLAEELVNEAKREGTFYEEAFRGHTNDLFRMAQAEIANILSMTVLARFHWEWATRNLSPEIAARETMEKLDAVLEAVKTELNLRLEAYGEQWSLWR